MYEGEQGNWRVSSVDTDHVETAMETPAAKPEANESSAAEQAEAYIKQATELVDSIYKAVQDNPELKTGKGGEFLIANLKNVRGQESTFDYGFLRITAKTNPQTEDTIREGIEKIRENVGNDAGDMQKAFADQIRYLEAVKEAVTTAETRLKVAKNLAQNSSY